MKSLAWSTVGAALATVAGFLLAVDHVLRAVDGWDR